MSAPNVSQSQRHTRAHPCKICGGYAEMPPGQGIRCAGFLSADGEWEHCTREEFAGNLKLDERTMPPTVTHYMIGLCRCGTQHGDEQLRYARPSPPKPPKPPKPSKEDMPLQVRKYLLETLPDGWKLTATYDYRDASGALVFVVLRYERPNHDGEGKPEKTFRQAHKVPGGWVMNLNGVTRVLYRLPELLAAPADAPVFILEGEKCVEALRAVGLVATCTSGGALQWDKTPGAAEALRGRRVIVLPDNDPPSEKAIESYKGQRHAVMVARDLDGIAAAVRVLELPGLPSKGDIVDWLQAGGTADELISLVAQAATGAEWIATWIAAHGATDTIQTEQRELSELSEEGSDGEEWEEPTPLPDDLPPVATLDPAMLPDGLRGWVFDIAERMDIPADYIGAPALVVACSLVGRRIGIHPKRRDDWQVLANTFGAIVAGPGMLKSAALGEVMKPLERLARDEAERHIADAALHEANKMRAAAQKAALAERMKAAAKVAAKSGDNTALDDLTREAASISVEERTPRRYKINDGTVEKIGMLLCENPQGLLVFRDELTGWLRTLDRAGHEGDRAFYLEAWNGDGSHDVERVGRGSLHIPALTLSVLGGIQPGPLASYTYEAGQDGAGADGLLQRFQLLVWPDAPRTYTHVDRWPNTDARRRAYDLLRGLASLTPVECGAAEDDVDDPDAIPMMRFSDTAQPIFDEWYTALQLRLRTGDVTGPLAAHLSKYASLMPSLALVFHLVDVLDGRATAADGVSHIAAAQAIAWCEYLETHARRLYASASNPDMERARALLRHIMRGDVLDGCTARDVHRRHWEKLSTADEVDAAVGVLEEYGWAHLEVRKGETGRPTKLLRVHPRFRRENTDTH